MAFNETKVNGKFGTNITLTTDDVADTNTNPYATYVRVEPIITEERFTSNPSYQDKHFYTIGELAVKTTDLLYWKILYPTKIVKISAQVSIAPTGDNIVLNIKKRRNVNGQISDTTIKALTIQQTQTIIQTGNEEEYTLDELDSIGIEVATIGSEIKGSDLVVSFKYFSTGNPN
jgi:hypothetical protein